MKCLGACGVLLTAATISPVHAQDGSASQTITVTGSAAQTRRDEVSGKQVISAEELARHGDTRLADALRRVPGIGIVGGGAELQIRLDGMSAEQTLVLLNGEPVPRSQVLEALALGMVERIEITRGANVQWSGRGLAGTINIITSRPARRAQRDLSLALGRYFGDPTGQAELNLADKDGAHSWRLGLAARADRERYPVDQEHRFTDPAGGVLSAFHVRTVEAAHDDAVTLTPQWQWENHQDSARNALLQVSGVLSASRFAGAGEDWRSDVQGTLPRMRDDRLAYRHDRGFGRLNLKASWPLSDHTRWSTSVMASRGRRDQTSTLTGNDFSGTAVRDSLVESTRVDDLLTARSDLQHRLGDHHALVTGLQLDGNRRQENRVQTERIANAEPDTDERYDATSKSLAVFVQDDWLADKTTTVSLGARLEWLQTRSEGNVFDGVHKAYRLGSPMANLLWRPRDGSLAGTQLKLGLSRAFRLPEPRDIMPRRWTRPENSSLVPDFIGNPALRPESAWTFTAGWEQRVGAASSLSLNGVLKRIDDVILDELVLQGTAYLLRRANYGRAQVASLQAQWQTEVPAAWGGTVKLALDGTVRHSRLNGLPGPDNRLPGQSPREWRVQADQPLEGTRWSWLAAWRWRAGFDAQAPSGRLLGTGSSRGLDLALSWQADPGNRWRLSASGLGSAGAHESITRTWAGGVDRYRATTEEAPRWRLQWMHKL